MNEKNADSSNCHPFSQIYIHVPRYSYHASAGQGTANSRWLKYAEYQSGILQVTIGMTFCIHMGRSILRLFFLFNHTGWTDTPTFNCWGLEFSGGTDPTGSLYFVSSFYILNVVLKTTASVEIHK